MPSMGMAMPFRLKSMAAVPYLAGQLSNLSSYYDLIDCDD
jgi:hypothetical protein